jgi:hypothetical protein
MNETNELSMTALERIKEMEKQGECGCDPRCGCLDGEFLLRSFRVMRKILINEVRERLEREDQNRDNRYLAKHSVDEEFEERMNEPEKSKDSIFYETH